MMMMTGAHVGSLSVPGCRPLMAVCMQLDVADAGPQLSVLLQQEVEEFVGKVNGAGGQFELFIYDDAGHAFLTSDDHRKSAYSLISFPLCPAHSLLGKLPHSGSGTDHLLA